MACRMAISTTAPSILAKVSRSLVRPLNSGPQASGYLRPTSPVDARLASGRDTPLRSSRRLQGPVAIVSSAASWPADGLSVPGCSSEVRRGLEAGWSSEIRYLMIEGSRGVDNDIDVPVRLSELSLIAAGRMFNLRARLCARLQDSSSCPSKVLDQTADSCGTNHRAGVHPQLRSLQRTTLAGLPEL